MERPNEPAVYGATLIGAAILLLLLLSRFAYIRDVRRRRKMTPDQRRRERAGDDGFDDSGFGSGLGG